MPSESAVGDAHRSIFPDCVIDGEIQYIPRFIHTTGIVCHSRLIPIIGFTGSHIQNICAVKWRNADVINEAQGVKLLNLGNISVVFPFESQASS